MPTVVATVAIVLAIGVSLFVWGLNQAFDASRMSGWRYVVSAWAVALSVCAICATW